MVIFTIDQSSWTFHNWIMDEQNRDYLKAKAMILMAHADEKLRPLEEKTLKHYLESLSLTEKQRALLHTVKKQPEEEDYRHMIDAVKSLDAEERDSLYRDIIRLAAADHHVSKNERLFLKTLYQKGGGAPDKWPEWEALIQKA